MDETYRGGCELLSERGKESLGRFECEIVTTRSGGSMADSRATVFGMDTGTAGRIWQARDGLRIRLDDGRETGFYMPTYATGDVEITLTSAPVRRNSD